METMLFCISIVMYFGVQVQLSLSVKKCAVDQNPFTQMLPRRDNSCRSEDGYFSCPNSHCCIGRSMAFDRHKDCPDGFDESAETAGKWSCTDAEFRCRTSNKCVPRRQTIDGCDYNRNILIRCRPKEEFQCFKSRRCIPRWMVFDRNRDCDSASFNDSSDEERGLESCLINEVRCQISASNGSTNARCIPRDWVADNVTDCNETNSDELRPLDVCYNATDFRCLSGRCLPRFRVRDGFADCPDNSDEVTTLDCNDDEIRCADNGRCIPRYWHRDGFKQCFDGSDENVTVGKLSCRSTEFICHNKRRCIPIEFLCDGVDNCGDCSDEIESCKHPMMLRCPNLPEKCLTWEYACDAFHDCPNGTEDFTALPGFKCTKRLFGSSSHGKYCSLPQWALYDNIPWCDDGSDICFSEDGKFVCAKCLDNETIIARRQICDGIVDCPDWSDECLCSTSFKTPAQNNFCSNVSFSSYSAHDQCSPGQLKCDNKCLKRHRICDGFIDCTASQLDEKYCEKGGTKNSLQNKEKIFVCNEIPKVLLDLAKILKMEEFANISAPVKAVPCDGNFECAFFEDECSSLANCKNRSAKCETIPLKNIEVPSFIASLTDSNTSVQVRNCEKEGMEYLGGNQICNGVAECTRGHDETDCEGRFFCNAGTAQWTSGPRPKVSVAISEVCDGNPLCDCVNCEDELNCSLSHFYCKSNDPLFISVKKVMDGKKDCSDYSDECPDSSEDLQGVSSNTEMIKNPALRAVVWIMAVLALFGNLLVAAKSIRSIASFRKNKQIMPMPIINNLLVLNLALADFLMGVSLFTIGGTAASFSGSYCVKDTAWRASVSCSTVGALTVLSSEASVATLICLTSYRIYGVFSPFQSRMLRVRTVLGFIVFLWATSLTIALLPLSKPLSAYMVSEMIISKSDYFRRGKATLAEVHRFVTRLGVLKNNGSFSAVAYDWQELEYRMTYEFKSHSPNVIGYHGYYSTNGVCLPKLFRVKGDNGNFNAFSIAVISFNFVSLFYIITAYVAIYFRSVKKGPNKSKNISASLQRKVSLLIATDLACWLPICIMSFIGMAGKEIPQDVYAFAAVVLLPINSALNPLIYSNIMQNAYKIFVSKCGSSSRCCCTTSTTMNGGEQNA